MAGFTGMDIDAVRQLATQMRTKAGEIDAIASALSNQLGSTNWVGNDQVQFTSDWQSQHMTALRNVSTALTDAATRADSNATQQENASA